MNPMSTCHCTFSHGCTVLGVMLDLRAFCVLDDAVVKGIVVELGESTNNTEIVGKYCDRVSTALEAGGSRLEEAENRTRCSLVAIWCCGT